MPNDKLDNLVKIGKLKPERATADEIAGLIRSGVARLADAKNETLSIESPALKALGPIWSKKMKGPTIWRLADGSARRTSKPPRSRERGMMRVSMGSQARGSPAMGSGQESQVIVSSWQQ